jgi:uncharacterized RDD family membrane protein YckC
MNLAGWGARVGAYIIDGLVPGVLSAIGYAFVAGGTDAATGKVDINPLAYVFFLLGIVVHVYNRWILAGKTGQSWGKKVLGIKLVGEETAQPIGGGMAFVRDLAHVVDNIICYIGYLFPLWDAKKQTIADKIVKTLVITPA